jgi:hypothetical protein
LLNRLSLLITIDASVRGFAGDAALYETFKQLLENVFITDRQVRYAIVGLLRNLVLPDTLKSELGPLAIRAFERWKVFDDEVGIQIMGPLVGGAMVALKLLCRGNRKRPFQLSLWLTKLIGYPSQLPTVFY